MKPAEALHAARRSLTEAGIEEPGLEAEVLLRHVLHWERHELYARLQEEISPAQQAEFQALIERRRAHEPTAYIVGRKEFYGLELETTPAALIPRPETELLVEEALRSSAKHGDEPTHHRRRGLRLRRDSHRAGASSGGRRRLRARRIG